MIDYILEKVENTTRFFKFGSVAVEEIEPVSGNVDLQAIFKAVENNFPSHYFSNLKAVKIGNFADLQNKNFSALYDDGIFYISNTQSDSQSILNDVVHEFAHHLEKNYTDFIYEDKLIIGEFLKKRQELHFELRSEGYWTDEYDFDELKYNEKFDNFLYKKVGQNLLRLVTSGMYIRPYSSVSLREYFATGFEAYYLGKRDQLEKISPLLFNRIEELHSYKKN
tara:strand:+ start:1434 stop:2102 length:669 start_codon:yes stop_codon:yes gene_type:complete